MLQVELNLISADPGLLGDPIRYIEATVRPAAERLTGNLGMSLHADRESGALVLETIWRDAQALAASRSAAVAAEATGCKVRDTHEYRLVFSTARTA